MNRDLTVGSPRRVLTIFALPMLLSVLFQQFYNMADNIVAGQFLGDAALDAVSISYTITMLYTAVALGINIGVNVVVSQLFGARQYARMKTAVSTALIATAVLSLLLTALGFLFSRPLLAAMKTPAEIMDRTLAYLLVYTAGLLCIFLYNTVTGIFSALGDTVTPLIFLIVSSLSNVGINILFVTVCGMDVEGLALATVLCQLVAAAASFLVLIRRLKTIPSGPFPRFNPHLLLSISRMAIPGICQKSFVSVGNLLVQGVVNGYAATVPGIIGGFSSATKLLYIVVLLNGSVGSSLASFTAQNIGAQRMDRLRGGMKAGITICMVLSVPSILFFLLLPRAAMGIFVPAESVDVIAAGASYLQVVSPFVVVVSFKQLCDGVLQGAGAARQFMVTTFSDLVLRVIFAYVLPLWMGYIGIWWAWPFGWILGTVISVRFYLLGRWKEVHLLEQLERD